MDKTPSQKLAEQDKAKIVKGLKFEVNEIKAIVAHELGHWQNNDQYKMMLFLTVEFGLVFYFFSLVINNTAILKSFGLTEKSNFFSLVVFLKFYEIMIFFTSKVQTWFIRKMEFGADHYAATEFEGDDIKHGLQHALIKAFKKNSANLNPDWLYAAATQSHPSLFERINAVPETHCKDDSPSIRRKTNQQSSKFNLDI